MQFAKIGAAVGVLCCVAGTNAAPILYGVDILSNRLVQIDRTTAAFSLGPTLTEGSPGGTSPFNGLTYDSATRELIAINPNTSRIHSIDPATGVTVTIGPAASLGSVNANGIAIDPLTSNLFVSTNNTNSLLTLSRASGAVLSATPITNAREIEGLAFDPTSRTLYGISQVDLRVFRIDVPTGVATPLSQPLPGGIWRGLEFDFETAQLLATKAGVSGGLYRIDPATGNASLVGGLPGMSVQGLALTPEPASLFVLVAFSLPTRRRR